MSSKPMHYTDLETKRGDITGSDAQAFGTGEDAKAYHQWHKRQNRLAIGTCTPGSSVGQYQYLYAPRIHTDLGGNKSTSEDRWMAV
jgi:hypothetical protein